MGHSRKVAKLAGSAAVELGPAGTVPPWTRTRPPGASWTTPGPAASMRERWTPCSPPPAQLLAPPGLLPLTRLCTSSEEIAAIADSLPGLICRIARIAVRLPPRCCPRGFARAAPHGAPRHDLRPPGDHQAAACEYYQPDLL